MDFSWSEEHEQFRKEVQDFIRQHNTPELRAELGRNRMEEGTGGPLMKKLRDEMDRRGWLKRSWPVEYGGEGKSPWYQYILVESLSFAGIPYGDLSVGSVAPAIMRFGTEAQKAKWLPKIWSGEVTFALGYSEPNAGTDLASLQTRAVRDGDEWVINGQKLWTSGAHVSTHVWLAARTDPNAPKHRGISTFIVPLDSPGITVRPVYTMAGVRTNETFYEDVRVPHDQLIGEEGRGWYTVANALDHERVSIAPLGQLVRQFDRLMDYLKEKRPELLQDKTVRMRLAEIKMDLHVQRALKTVNAAIIARGDTPTMEASMTKIWSSELRYRMSSMAMDLLGRYGSLARGADGLAPIEGEMEQTYRASPILRFGGGTNEVQRNIIAQRGLGLPR